MLADDLPEVTHPPAIRVEVLCVGLVQEGVLYLMGAMTLDVLAEPPGLSHLDFPELGEKTG